VEGGGLILQLKKFFITKQLSHHKQTTKINLSLHANEWTELSSIFAMNSTENKGRHRGEGLFNLTV